MQTNALLLYGWAYNSNCYDKFLSSAPNNWNIYTLNHADTLKKHDVISFRKLFLRFLEQNKLSNVILIAHSLGGIYAIDLASKFPDKVERVILINSAGMLEKGNTINYLIKFFRNKRVDGLRNFKNNIKGGIILLKNIILLWDVFVYSRNVNLESEAKQVTAPTTIIWGNKDYITPLYLGEKLHSLIRNSKFVVLKNYGHDWPMYAPEQLWKNLK